MKKPFILSACLLFLCPLSFISCTEDEYETKNVSKLNIVQNKLIHDLFSETLRVHQQIENLAAVNNAQMKRLKQYSEYTNDDFEKVLELSESFAEAGIALYREFGFSEVELISLGGNYNPAVFGLAAIEAIAELEGVEIDIFGEHGEYQVVSKEFLKKAIACIIGVLGLDVQPLIYAAIEAKLLTKELLKEAIEKVVKQVLKRSATLAAAGTVGVAVVMVEWVVCVSM